METNSSGNELLETNNKETNCVETNCWRRILWRRKVVETNSNGDE